MSYAPKTSIKNVIGTFKDANGRPFDYEANSPNNSLLPFVSWPHRVWVSDDSLDAKLGYGWRYANVMTDVVFLADDEVIGFHFWAPNKKLAIKDHIIFR